ncbi:MAG: hypothetical protein SGJ05_08520 [bacterium]|nr:hypothetical protein [bacterium]
MKTITTLAVILFNCTIAQADLLIRIDYSDQIGACSEYRIAVDVESLFRPLDLNKRDTLLLAQFLDYMGTAILLDPIMVATCNLTLKSGVVNGIFNSSEASCLSVHYPNSVRITIIECTIETCREPLSTFTSCGGVYLNAVVPINITYPKQKDPLILNQLRILGKVLDKIVIVDKK